MGGVLKGHATTVNNLFTSTTRTNFDFVKIGGGHFLGGVWFFVRASITFCKFCTCWYYICRMNWYIIKQKRKRMGLSQKEIARLMEMSRARYNRIERGYGSITLVEFERLLGLLGFSLRIDTEEI